MAFLPVLLALKDRQLRGKDGDEEVRRLGHLLEGFRPRLRWMAGGELADEDAIFNLACFSISNAAGRFNGSSEGEARRYCWQTVNRGAVDAYRRAGGRWMYKVSARGGLFEADDTGEADPCSSPLSETEFHCQPDSDRQEDRDRVREALRCLNAADRELVERIGIRGERIRDLANRLGVRENTLTQRWRRACARLRKILTSEKERPEDSVSMDAPNALAQTGDRTSLAGRIRVPRPWRGEGRQEGETGLAPQPL